MNIQKYQAMLEKIKSPFDPQIEYRNYYPRIIDSLNGYKRLIHQEGEGPGYAMNNLREKLQREVGYGYISEFEVNGEQKKVRICWLNKQWTEFNLP